MRKVISILPLLLFCLPGFNQELPSIHYEVENGLPSSELYDVVQDKEGFIWIASDRGVSRFDGYTFTNFTTKDGLTDNTIFNIWPDKNGRLWFNAFNGRLCYYEKGTFKVYAFNDSILKYTPGVRILRTFEMADDGSLMLGYQKGGLLKISATGSVNKIMEEQGADYVISSDEKTGRFLAGKNSSIPVTRKDSSYVSYDCAGKKGRLGFVHDQSTSDLLLPFHRRNDDYYFSMHSVLFIVKPSGEIIQQKMSSSIIRMCEDRDSCLWISSRNGGVHKYKPNEAPAETDAGILFPEEDISCVFEDNEHGLWFTTLKNGMYYVPSTAFRFFSGEDKMKPCNITGQGTSLLFIGAKEGEIYCRKNDQWRTVFPFDKRGAGQPAMSCLFYDSLRGDLFAAYNLGVIRIDSMDRASDFMFVYANDFAANANDVFISGANAVGREKDGKFLSFGYGSRPEALYCDKLGKLWVVGRLGLGYVSNDKVQPADTTNSLLKSKMLCLTGLPNNKIVIGTIENGVIIYDPATRKTKNILQEDGLAGNNVNALFVAADGSLWVGTNNGLSHLFDPESDHPVIQNYGVESGLPSPEILSVFVSGEEVWVASRKNVVYFIPASIKKNEIPPPVYFTKIFAGDSALNVKAAAELSYDKNMLRFSFVGLNYRSRGKVRYRYVMEGLNEKSIITSVPEASFLAVPPGEYQLRVWAINEDGVESASPAVFSFVIHPPFWKTTWFGICAAGFAIIIIVVSVNVIIRRIRKQNQLSENLLEYQQQALSNQMNPHFIFNSLNTVQSYILREDKLSATRYLSRFSRLMRMSLDHSQLKLVPISQELKLIRVYLELEAMRFGESLNWSVEIPPAIESGDYKVPSMLIQPYIENAIRHGILNREDKAGKISVRFIFENNELRCEVEDNGVGRAHAENKRDIATHHSAGTAITASRLELICKSMKIPFRFNVIDLEDKNGNATGTIIIFNLPFLNSKDEN